MTEIGSGEITGGIALAALAIREAFNFVKGRQQTNDSTENVRYAMILSNQTAILAELVSSHRELSNNLVKFMAFMEGRGGFRHQ